MLMGIAETLLTLIDPNDEKNAIALATKELEAMSAKYAVYRLNEMKAKFGLETLQEGDGQLIDDLFEILAKDKVDYTQFFRA